MDHVASEPFPPTGLPPRQWRLYALMIVVALALVGLFTYWVRTAERVRIVNSLLLNGVKEVRLQATNAHLWIEETLDGHQPSLGIEEIRQRIDLALAAIAHEKQAASREVVYAIGRAVAAFRSVDPRQAARLKTPADIEAFSRRHDRADRQLRVSLDAIEDIVRQKIERDRFRIQAVQVAIVCMLVAAGCFLSLAVRRYRRRISASQKFLKIANRHTRTESMLSDFLPEIRVLSGADAVGIRLLDGAGSISCAVQNGFGSRLYERLEVLDADKLRGQCRREGFMSAAFIPIRLDLRTLGLIHVAGKRRSLFSAGTIDILEQAAMTLGAAIQRVRVEEALEASASELEERVRTRTRELVQVNRQLEEEIEERRRTELELLEYEDRLRSMSSELLLTGERERHRIATEIHDRIGQTLALSRIRLGLLMTTVGEEPARGMVDEIRKLVEQSIQDTRTLTFELSPPMLYELGLEATVEWAAEQIQQQSGLRIAVETDAHPKPLEDRLRVFLYRAVRELLHNVNKHAGARSAVVRILRDGDTIRVEVADDGGGFDPQAATPDRARRLGFGLFSIREQVRHFGGRLKIDAAPGRGTRIVLELSLSAEGHEAPGGAP